MDGSKLTLIKEGIAVTIYGRVIFDARYYCKICLYYYTRIYIYEKYNTRIDSMNDFYLLPKARFVNRINSSNDTDPFRY